MSTQVVDLVRDSTMQKMQAELVAVHKASVLASGSTAAIDQMYNALVNNASTVAEVNGLFVQWWRANWTEGTTTRNELLERWFGTVLDDDRVHGVKFPLFPTSETAIGELTDDSARLTCTPSTETTAEQDDFAHLPQFWSVLVAAEKAADGSHTIYAVEFIDSYDEVRGGTHLCWALQKNTYTREWNEDGYRYFKMQCRPATGYDTWPQGTDRTGKVHAYIGNPAYAAGLDADGNVTCGTGLPPLNYSSHNTDVAKWRARGSQYSGASGNLIKWQLAMIRLKYARKGNSGTIEGCTAYNYQYKAAAAETGVTRVLLTATQAKNLFVGSSVIVGDTGTGTSADRGTASMEVFNDADGSLINIYRCIKYHPEAVAAELALLPDSREVFFDSAAQTDCRGLTDIQRAARSLYLIKMSFGCDRRTFATAPKIAGNISASFAPVQERLRKVIIEHLDFEQLIRTYDRPNALFYCDPPYMGTEKYYQAAFSTADHERLARVLHNIRGRFLLSYNDCEAVRKLYEDCEITPLVRRNNLPSVSTGEFHEVLISNYTKSQGNA